MQQACLSIRSRYQDLLNTYEQFTTTFDSIMTAHDPPAVETALAHCQHLMQQFQTKFQDISPLMAPLVAFSQPTLFPDGNSMPEVDALHLPWRRFVAQRAGYDYVTPPSQHGIAIASNEQDNTFAFIDIFGNPLPGQSYRYNRRDHKNPRIHGRTIDIIYAHPLIDYRNVVQGGSTVSIRQSDLQMVFLDIHTGQMRLRYEAQPDERIAGFNDHYVQIDSQHNQSWRIIDYDGQEIVTSDTYTRADFQTNPDVIVLQDASLGYSMITPTGLVKMDGDHAIDEMLATNKVSGHANILIARKGDRYRYLQADTGNDLFPDGKTFAVASPFLNGHAWVSDDRKTFFCIDGTGARDQSKSAIVLSNVDASSRCSIHVCDFFVVITVSGRLFFYNQSGQRLIQKYASHTLPAQQDRCCIVSNNEKQLSLVTDQDRKVSNQLFREIVPFGDGRHWLVKTTEQQWHMIDDQGRMSPSLDIDASVSTTSRDGVLVVIKDEAYELLDVTGQKIFNKSISP